LEALVSTLLPLFPLDVVLLPGVPLPLHIFEPRYKEMIMECLDQKKPFGVVRSKEEGIAEIGCTAEIMAVTKKYSDGRMDIVSEGRERFEVMQLNQERSFLRAEVLYLQDEPGGAPPEKISQALKLHGQILSLAGAEPETLSEIAGAKLSFHLAGSLPLDPDFKQTLLGMKSEAERLEGTIAYFEAILPNLQRTVSVRRKSGGNGHI
jgi:Lon protease-like protein